MGIETIETIKNGKALSFHYQPKRTVVQTGRGKSIYKNNPRIHVLTVVYSEKEVHIFAGKFPDWWVRSTKETRGLPKSKYLTVKSGMPLHDIKDKFVSFSKDDL